MQSGACLVAILWIVICLFLSCESDHHCRSYGTNDLLVDHLVRESWLTQGSSAHNAMLLVNRGDFINPPDADKAYQDCPQFIGHGVTISAPHMHAVALTFLEPNLQPGKRVLDVGSGSGYLSAAMATMVGKQGRVIGVEHNMQLIDVSFSNIRKHHAELLKENGQLSLLCEDILRDQDFQYLEKQGPFDAIHVGAAADGEIAIKLSGLLKNGGRMVIPEKSERTGGQLMFTVYNWTFDPKMNHWKLTYNPIMKVNYVPLTLSAKGRSG